jgi:FAD:protein FMN transferase
MALQHTYEFEAIGTPWSIETNRPLDTREIQEINAIIADFTQAFSRFQSDSLVQKARAEAPTQLAFPASVVELYDTYAQLEHLTEGAVNPLVGESLEHWGYDAHYSLKPATTKAPHPEPFAQTVMRTGTSLTFAKPALLDVGAIGKGKLIDLVTEHLAQKHNQLVVEAGGDMRIITKDPYIVGLEHPADTSLIIGSVELNNQSICASAPNRRAWGDGLHHIIDARTGRPSDSDIVATWVVADTATQADALTTALFFTPATVLQQHFGDFTYIIMKKDAHVEHNMK